MGRGTSRGSCTEINPDYLPSVPLEDQLAKMQATIEYVNKIVGVVKDQEAVKYKSELKAALTIIATGWLVSAPYSNALQRKTVEDYGISKLKALAKQVLEMVLDRMLLDLRNAREGRASATAAMKLEVVMATERDIRAIVNRARLELAEPYAFREISTESTNMGDKFLSFFGRKKARMFFTPGEALQQLEEVRRTGPFWN